MATAGTDQRDDREGNGASCRRGRAAGLWIRRSTARGLSTSARDSSHAETPVVRNDRSALQHAAPAASRARPRAAACRAAPSCARTRRCRTAGRSRARPPRQPRALVGMIDQPDDRVGQRAGVALRHDHARRARRSRMSSRPSASVATIGLPIASASNTVSGVPSQSDGNTLRSNADSDARDVARETRRRRTGRRGRARAACASRSARSGPSPTRKNRALRPLARRTLRGGVDQIRVALRIVQPRDRADRRTRPGAMPSSRRAPAISSALRGAAELLERHAEVDDLHLRRPASAAR